MNRAWDAIHLEPCIFFFLLSFFLLLINNLHLDYFYRNHDNEWLLAPLSWCKRRIGQGRGQRRLETQHVSIKPSVCFFFFFKFLLLFLYTKCLFSRDLPQWQQTVTTITINETNADVKCPLLSPHKWWAKDWAEQQKGQQGLETWHVLSPSVCFFSFFTYFLSSKYLFASRTTAS